LVANIGSDSSFFSVSIHLPGCGSQRISAGSDESRAYGADAPRPSAPNTASASPAGRVTAQPSAAPMNGAVHGAAAAIANTPEKNAPARPWRVESFSPRPIQRAPNSK